MFLFYVFRSLKHLCFPASILNWDFVWEKILGHGLVATVIGVIVGIPVALWLNRRIKQKEDDQDYQRERMRERNTLNLIKEELEFSKQGLDLRKANLSHLCIQPLKTELWEAMSGSGALSLIESPELLNRITSAYYVLRIVRRMEEACYSATRTATVTFSDGRTGAAVTLADAQTFYELLENNMREALIAIDHRISQIPTKIG